MVLRYFLLQFHVLDVKKVIVLFQTIIEVFPIIARREIIAPLY